MNADLKPLIELAMKDARERVLEGDEYMRMFFAADAEGKVNIICAPSMGPDDGQILQFLRMVFVAWGVVQYAMVSEVWVSHDLDHHKSGKTPSEDPKRSEAIMALAVRHLRGESGETIKAISAARALITRNPTAVSDIEWEQGTQFGGRMTELLPPPDVPTLPEPIRKAILKAIEAHPEFQFRTLEERLH